MRKQILLFFLLLLNYISCGYSLVGNTYIANFKIPIISRKQNIEIEFTTNKHANLKLDGFINIGFFVFNIKVLEYLNDDCILETTPLSNLAKDSALHAFKHFGYFEPMDTYREYLQLNKYWESGNPPWLSFDK